MAEGGDDGDHEPGIVWACTECGRHHQKNSPPCKRCGNVHLEKRTPDYSDLENPGGTSYLDVLEPKYALGYLAVIGFVVLLVLSLAGIVSVPWLGGPSPPGAPGEAETFQNVSLQDVEDAYVDDINERRTSVGADTLSVDDRLDDVATEFNQRRVRAAAGDGDRPSIEAVFERYEPSCRETPRLARDRADAASVFRGGTTDPATVAANLPIAAENGSTWVRDSYDSIGVDVHVGPDDTVFATVIAC